jgi:hypothetical protein
METALSHDIQIPLPQSGMADREQPLSAPLLYQFFQRTVDHIFFGFKAGQCTGFIKQVGVKDHVGSGKHDTPHINVIIHIMIED